MNTEKETTQAFLPIPNEEDVEADFNDWRYEKASLRKKYFRYFAIFQIALLLLYAAGFSIIFGRAPSSQHDSHGGVELAHKTSTFEETGRTGEHFVYTPAESVDKFHKTELNMHLYKGNPYKGPPTPEVDAAWDKLFTNAYIRLSEDELVKLGRTSAPIPDGSGDYFGALDVYHQLHCVRFIFQYVHQDYYTLKKINVPAPDHINHCIDVLREVVMCLGDTSISTLTFHDDYPRTWPEFKFDHSCRNWDAVDSWAGRPGRAVDQSDPVRMEKWLQNPNFINTTRKFFDGHGEDD